MTPASDLLLREIKEEDISFIQSLSSRIKRMEEKEIRDYLELSFLSGYVLKRNGENIGYILSRSNQDECEIDDIAILQEEEGKGIASTLLSLFLEKMDGKTNICLLECRRSNTRANNLYLRAGFEPYRVRKNYYGDEDSICYRKEIL